MSDTIELPPPDERGGLPLDQVLARRRSVREFASRPLEWKQVGQLLWAAQGVSDRRSGLRTAPSAGALYPLDIDVALPSGLYRYRPATHSLVRRVSEDLRAALARAAMGQSWLAQSACIVAIAGITQRTSQKYGPRAERYVHMEAGHAAQNLLLAAVSLGLAAVPVGAFGDNSVSRVLQLMAGEQPLYLVPIGWGMAASAR